MIEDEKDFEEWWTTLTKPYTKNDPYEWIWKGYAKSAWLASRRTLMEKIAKVVEELKKIQFELNETPKESSNYGHLLTIMYGIQGEFEELIGREKEGKDG